MRKKEKKKKEILKLLIIEKKFFDHFSTIFYQWVWKTNLDQKAQFIENIDLCYENFSKRYHNKKQFKNSLKMYWLGNLLDLYLNENGWFFEKF